MIRAIDAVRHDSHESLEVALILPPARRPYEACYLSNLQTMRAKLILPRRAPDEISYQNVETLRLDLKTIPLLGRVFRTVASPSTYPEVEGWVRGADALVSVELFSFLSHSLTKLAKRTRRRMLIIVWETIASHPYYALPWLARNARTVSRLADGFIATTDRAADHLRLLGIDYHRITKIYPGVDTRSFSPERQADGDERILFVGRLATHKGFDILLKAFRQLRRSRKNLELVVAGEGPLRSLLSTAYGEGVTYLGQLPYGSMPNLYRRCSILVTIPKVTTRLGVRMNEEQFGFTVVEAMSSGLPVLASRCGATGEVLGASDVQLLDRSDATSVAARLNYFLDNRDAARKAGDANRARVLERFDASKQSRSFEEYVLAQ